MDAMQWERGSGIAVWRRIADEIEAEIAAGRLAPGTRLPTEGDLAQRFGVNRHTVRRALAVLAEKGLVRAQQGSGTFVEARAIPYPIGPRTRFSEIMSRAGREATGDLIGVAETVAGATLSAVLGVAEGAPLVALTTRHRADGVPISWSVTHLPLPRFAGVPEAYRETGSLTRALAACGVPDYVRRSTLVAGRLASNEDAAMLELAAGRPVLVIDSVNADAAGVPIQATRAVFAADRVELRIES